MAVGDEGLPFDPYAVLGVSSSASTDDIRHAYRILARTVLPATAAEVIDPAAPAAGSRRKGAA